ASNVGSGAASSGDWSSPQQQVQQQIQQVQAQMQQLQVQHQQMMDFHQTQQMQQMQQLMSQSTQGNQQPQQQHERRRRPLGRRSDQQPPQPQPQQQQQPQPLQQPCERQDSQQSYLPQQGAVQNMQVFQQPQPLLHAGSNPSSLSRQKDLQQQQQGMLQELQAREDGRERSRQLLVNEPQDWRGQHSQAPSSSSGDPRQMFYLQQSQMDSWQKPVFAAMASHEPFQGQQANSQMAFGHVNAPMGETMSMNSGGRTAGGFVGSHQQAAACLPVGPYMMMSMEALNGMNVNRMPVPGNWIANSSEAYPEQFLSSGSGF
ncbi:unnamed protein product, partial [Polarella glacialis]